MADRIYQVDAFAAEPFAGNPAAVCLPEGPRDDHWMQHLAAEMNLSETAFLARTDDGWRLRWFTPTVEVDLCGHATLASAHVLWESGLLPATEAARFHTRSGLLTARRDTDWIDLDFPARPPKPAPDAPAEVAEALGVTPVSVHDAGWAWLLELADAAAVRAAKPDFAALAAAPRGAASVTAAGDAPGVDFVSRFFVPAAGIDEDPVTGSAHCFLTPFWAARTGKDRMLAHQESARGGVVRVATAGDRVKIAGQAVTIFRGELA